MDFKYTSVVKRVELPKKFDVLHAGECKKGDVVILKIVSEPVEKLKFLRDKKGKKWKYVQGDIILSALSNRYAPTRMRAEIPKHLKNGDMINILEYGGTAGVIKELAPDYKKVYAEFLGFPTINGKIVNVKDFSIEEKEVKYTPKLIISVGVLENCGKTTTCMSLTQGLTDLGYRVCAGKVSGLGNVADTMKSMEKGAIKVLDIIDAGCPSTVGLSHYELDEVFLKIYSNLALEKPDFIIIEIADGITQRETNMLVNSKVLKKFDPVFVVSVNDPVGAFGAKVMMNHLPILFFSGRGTTTEMGRTEISETTGIQAFNPLTQQKEMVDYLLDFFECK